MAGLMNRTATVIKAKYSKLLNKAENPTETLDYSYEQMLEQLQNMKRGVADVATSKKRIELQQQKLEQNVVTLEGQARQAVAANRDDLATQALQRKADRAAAAAGDGRPGQAAPGPAGQARRRPAAAPDEDRVVPLAEGDPQGAVLRRRGAGQGRRGRDRDRQGHGRHRHGDPAREGQDRGDAGTRGRDRRAHVRAARSRTSPRATRISSRRSSRRSPRANQVDDELAKLKAEVGTGDAPKEIAGRPSDAAPADDAPADDAPAGRPEPGSATSSSAARSSRSRRRRGSSRSRPRP